MVYGSVWFSGLYCFEGGRTCLMSEGGIVIRYCFFRFFFF